MALWIKPNSAVFVGDGTKATAELFADTASDLATTCDGISLEKGSTADVIDEGVTYVLDSSYSWVSPTPAESKGR